jgi:hypothetical protein
MNRIFDLGPQPPVKPVRPQVLREAVDLPPGAEGHPTIEPETARYNERYRDYLRQMDLFPAERAEWERRHGQAIEVTVDTLECIDRDPRRYCRQLPKGTVTARG